LFSKWSQIGLLSLLSQRHGKTKEKGLTQRNGRCPLEIGRERNIVINMEFYLKLPENE